MWEPQVGKSSVLVGKERSEGFPRKETADLRFQGEWANNQNMKNFLYKGK